MAENPVLTEARKKGIISAGTIATGTGNSAVTQSGSANPVVREFNGTQARERAANQQRIIETARQQPAAQPAQESSGTGFLDRLKNTVSGAAKSAASAYANVGGMAAEGAGKWNTRIANYEHASEQDQAAKAVERYQAMLDSGKWADGRALTAADRKQVQAMLAANQRKLDAHKGYTSAVEASDKAVADQAYQTADRLSESGAQNIAAAKEGLGKVGQFAVDLGTQGVQMAGDIAASALIPGAGLALMSTRSAGSAAQEARQAGASYGQQLAYGLGSGAVSLATEKLASVAAPFKKAFGGGVLDEALAKAIAKMNGNAAGKLALSMLSEGTEEVVEDLVQPILQRMTYDKSALGQYGNSDYWAQTIYDGLVGAAMGGLGSGVELAQNRRTAQRAAQASPTAQATAQEGNDTTPAQNAPQGTQNAVPEAGTAGSVKVGRVTTIKTPYRGEVPAQTARQNTTPVRVSNDSLTTAQNRIAGARGLESSMPGLSFKSSLKNAYKGVFKAAKGIPVEGMTFNGKQYQVDIPNSVPGKVISDNNLTAEKLALLDNLSDVVRNGEYVGSGEYVAHGAKTKNTVRYDYFEAPVEIGGKPYIASFDVEVFPDTNNYRTHKLNEIELSSTTSADTGRDPAANVERTAQFEGTRPLNVDSNIAQNAENVNMQGQGDILSQILFGGKRADMNTLTEAQQNAVYAANDAGTVGMDAAGMVFEIDPERHIDRRTAETVGNRGVNAFQFDHPEMQRYYRQAAEALIADADLSLQQPLSRRYERTMQGNAVQQAAQTSAHLRQAMDETGLSRGELIDAAQRIVADHGQENVAAAKRVELILDDMLSHGYTTMYGDAVAPNEAYLAAKQGIPGAVQAEEAGRGLDGIGAANAGSLNSDFQNLQAQSDTFHPEGANAARPVDVPTKNFEGRNVPKSASTVMGAQGINDNTVLWIEQQIADGTLAFDTIKDVDAVSRAQQTMQQKGFDGALEQYRHAANAGVATKDNTTLGQQLLLQASRDGNEAAIAEILTLYTRNSTTAAQAMQAQSILRKLSPEGQLTTVQRALNDLNDKYNTDVQLTESEISDFLNAKDEAERQKVRERIEERAAQSVPGTFRAKYDALRYLAMLGNPRTHIRNILGNTLFQAPVAVKNRVGALLELGVDRASGGKVERTKSVLGANPFGKLAAEARADWANAEGFLTQSGKYNEGQTSLSSIEQKADAFTNENVVGRNINRLSNTNSALLEAEDTAAKKFIYSQSLAGYLKANGVQSIGDASPDLLNRARNYAAQEALRNTFNDRNKVSDAVAKLGNLSRRDNPVEKAAGYVVEGVLPFKRTPTNILVRAAEYNPISSVVNAVAAVRNAKAGDVDAVVRNLDRVAAGVSGTALLAAGALAAGAGYVTGGEDDDEKQQDFDDLTGHQNYALELKDGMSVTLDWLAPEAIPFFMGVELYNAYMDHGLTLDELADTLKNASAPMLEMSMLQGLNDTVNNASYAVNHGDSVIGALITSALTNYLTQIVPTLGGQVERVGETERMTTYVDKNSSVPSDLQYTIGKVSQKVPGWDYQQIPYIDAWGRTEETGGEAERIFNNFFNPAYVSQVDVDKVEQELQRVKDATGDGNVFPKRADRSITVNGETKNLTAEEYQKYAKALGQGSYTLVKEGLALPAYQAMSDTGKAEYISRLYRYAAQTAKAEISNYETESWVSNAKTAQKDIGVSAAEYLALYEKYGAEVMSGTSYEKTKQAVKAGLTVDQWVDMKGGLDADGNGSVSQSEAEAYLSGKHFSNSTKADLWTIINKSWKKNPYA